MGWQNIIRRLDPSPSLLMRKDGELLGESDVLKQKVVPRPQSVAHERAVGCQYSIRIWESGEWQTRTAECRQRVGDPLFVPLTSRGADPRSESYRYGWSSWAPQGKLRLC